MLTREQKTARLRRRELSTVEAVIISLAITFVVMFLVGLVLNLIFQNLV